MNDLICSSPSEHAGLSRDRQLLVLPDISIDSKRELLEQQGNIVLRSENIDGLRITATTDLRNVYIEHDSQIVKAEDVIFDAWVLDREDVYRAIFGHVIASVVDLIGSRFSEDPQRDSAIKENFYSKSKLMIDQKAQTFEQIVFNQEGKVAVTEQNLVTFRAVTYCEQQEISPELTTYSDYQQKEVDLYRANPELYEAVMRLYVWAVSAGIPVKDEWSPEIEDKVAKAADNLWQDYLRGDLKRPFFKRTEDEDDEVTSRHRRLSKALPMMEV